MNIHQCKYCKITTIPKEAKITSKKLHNKSYYYSKFYTCPKCKIVFYLEVDKQIPIAEEIYTNTLF